MGAVVSYSGYPLLYSSDSQPFRYRVPPGNFSYTCVPLSLVRNVFIEIDLKMTVLFNMMFASVFLAQADLCGEPPCLLHIGSRERLK